MATILEAVSVLKMWNFVSFISGCQEMGVITPAPENACKKSEWRGQQHL
jgi:hypothetical protein